MVACRLRRRVRERTLNVLVAKVPGSEEVT
jgi:hypothetical protein